MCLHMAAWFCTEGRPVMPGAHSEPAPLQPRLPLQTTLMSMFLLMKT